MKKTIAILMLSLIISAGFSQQLDPEKMKVRDDLLQKSKNQKTTAFLMLGLGAAAAVAGTIIFEQNFDIWDDSNDQAAGTGAVLATAGGLSMLGSIPFFIASSKNKGRAMGMSAGIRVEKMFPDGVFKNNVGHYPVATLTLQIK